MYSLSPIHGEKGYARLTGSVTGSIIARNVGCVSGSALVSGISGCANQSAFVVRDIEKFVNSLDNIQMKKLFLGR